MKVGSSLLAIFVFMAIETPVRIHAYRVVEGQNNVVTILALLNEPISIKCSTDIAMSYCGFVHPSGKRFSFSGNELKNGRCVKKINATKADTGLWKCHIGGMSTGVETVQKIELRVVDKVAAVMTNVTVEDGHSVTLECVTTQGYLPLSYCRFEPPASAPFSINAAINKTNAIQHRYFFPPNRSLDRGDCAVTIQRTRQVDLGIWTCGAGMSDGKEYTDSIMVIVEGLYTMSTATSVGLVFGVLLIVTVLVILGYIAWYKRRALGGAPGEPNAGFNEGHEMADLEMPRPPSPPISVTPSRRSPPGSRRSPTGSIRLPTLIVQSPSEPGSSPLMS